MPPLPFHRSKRNLHSVRLWSLLVLAGTLFSESALAAAPDRHAPDHVASEAYDWQRTDKYLPANFESYFPEDADGAAALKTLLQAPDRDARPDAEILDTVRRGLRTMTQDNLEILRWIGNKYIGVRDDVQQNPQAIELMYHASQEGKYGTAYNAVYFGLSVVREKTPNILHALADLAMASSDPNTLHRIVWAVTGQREAFLPYLEPYKKKKNTRVQEKCRIVEQLVRGELDAFEWARERDKSIADKQFRSKLPDIKNQMLTGDSAKRAEVVRTIENNNLLLIMDESFLEAWSACAQDPDPEIRRLTARMVGQEWIWGRENQPTAAIEMLVGLANDADPKVQYNAVYFGLSVITQKDDRILREMVEMLLNTESGDLSERLLWGMRSCRDQVAALLEEIMAGYKTDPERALDALDWYRKICQKDPPLAAALTRLRVPKN